MSAGLRTRNICTGTEFIPDEGIPLIFGQCQPFTDAIIAVDDISLDNVFFSDGDQAIAGPQPIHPFVYECLPLTADERCFPVHIMSAMSENAGKSHITASEAIVRVLAQLSDVVNLLFVATDSDNGYTSTDINQFNHWLSAYRVHDLSACLDLIRFLGPFSVIDFLQLDKNVRSRLLDFILVLRHDGAYHKIQLNVMEAHLHLGAVF
jgi:hypothetical protein